jgi:hypothetical protein
VRFSFRPSRSLETQLVDDGFEPCWDVRSVKGIDFGYDGLYQSDVLLAAMQDRLTKDQQLLPEKIGKRAYSQKHHDQYGRF